MMMVYFGSVINMDGYLERSQYFTSDDWLNLWREGSTPWDLEGSHSHSAKLWQFWQEVSQQKPDGLSVVMPGAGRAHDAEIFLSAGCQVTALDLSAEAAHDATSKYEVFYHQGLFDYRVGDMFALDLKESADLIFDRAVLCAFHRDLREQYRDFCCQCLKVGGWFLSLPFSREESTSPQDDHEKLQPPYFLSASEIFTLMSEHFHLIMMEAIPSQADNSLPFQSSESMMIWQKISP
ncbi:MAG: methyltransferase domain-containing protein [Proteobacteria bacterium]|nr:methyltransferase domain-containing protein [Pseudomonadota bacterium]